MYSFFFAGCLSFEYFSLSLWNDNEKKERRKFSLNFFDMGFIWYFHENWTDVGMRLYIQIKCKCYPIQFSIFQYSFLTIISRNCYQKFELIKKKKKMENVLWKFIVEQISNCFFFLHLLSFLILILILCIRLMDCFICCLMYYFIIGGDSVYYGFQIAYIIVN